MKHLKKILAKALILPLLLMAIPVQTVMAVDQVTVTLTIDDNSFYESEPGVPFTFTRTGGTELPLTVNFSVSGTATRGPDYCLSESNEDIIIPAGQSSVDLTFSGCIVDAVDEETETIVITLSDGDDYVMGSGIVTAYLYDGEAPPTVTITAFDSVAYESGDNDISVFRFTRTGDTTSDLTVGFTESGTASRLTPFDYQLSVEDLSVVILAGSSYADLEADGTIDDEVEDPETIIITISDGDEYVVGNSYYAIATLYDGEDPADGGVTEYNGEVTLDVVQDGDNYISTTEEFDLIPSGADFGTVTFGYGITLTAGAPWDGTLTASAGEVETPSDLGFTEAKSIDITKGDYEGPLQSDNEVIIYFTYDGFSDFTTPTVKVDSGDTTDTIEHCSDAEWIGTSLNVSPSDMIDNFSLEADTACYIGADDVDDEGGDFVMIATRHLSEFIAGEGVAVNNNNGGGSVVIRDVIIEVDSNSVDVVTPVEVVSVPDTPAIDAITRQIVDTAEVVKTNEEIKAEETRVVAEVEKDVEELFAVNLVDTDEPSKKDNAVLDSVKDLFSKNGDADLDGIPNYKDANSMTKDTELKDIFTKAEDSTVANLKVASVSSNGFVLSGTTKPNFSVIARVGDDEFRTTSDVNGHYLILAEFPEELVGLFAVETEVDGKTSKVLIKAEADTIPQPEMQLEGKQISTVEDFTADDLLAHVKKIENKWVRKVNVVALTFVKYSPYYDVVVARLDVRGTGDNMIVKGTATPGSTVVLAYKSVIYSSVVIADKNGKFEASVPKDLATELTADKNLSEVEHQLIAFSVDYKTNKVSPFVKDLFKMYK